jgi:hypothetical protein
MNAASVHSALPPEAESWQARNAEYLGAALAALRQRLQAASNISRAMASSQRAAHEPPPSEPEARPAPSNDRGPMSFFWRRSSAEPAAAPVPLLASPSSPTIEVPSDDPVRRMAAASEGDPPPALLMLARRLGLSEFDRDILLLCVAMELDPATASLCASVHGQPDRDYATFAAAMNLFDRPEWEAVSPERPLRYWRLIDINQPGGRPLTASALRADERIVNYVKGLNYLDDRLAPLVLRMAPPPQGRTLPRSQEAAVDAMAQALRTAPSSSTTAVVALRGSDRPSKHEVAGAAAARLGLSLYRLPVDALPAQAAELETLARLWTRESLLLPLALYIDAHEVDAHAGADSPVHRLGRFVARLGGLVFVDSREGIDLPLEPLVVLDVAKPTTAEQQHAWADAIGDRAPAVAPLLAAQFDLSRPDIEAILKSVPAVQTGAAEVAGGADAAALEAALWDACRARTRPALSRLAEKIDARATWKQLVLPPSELALLKQIAGQVRTRSRVYDEWGFRARMTRGLGVSALFAGDSGTGKTMAAEVLANDLKLDLYRIDLSAVVSKYIGETEKNLREVFDAAERGGAILLFDEADALFGKRSEVKDSHDRYANIEVDYLLQRMESFAGLAILATNIKSALDTAFVRRLRFIVTFPYPGPAERRRMWEGVFPEGTPLGKIDHERLARLHLTGGNIQSMALTAAFMAAQLDVKKEDRRVTMPLLLDAGRMEFRKLDRPVNEADFRWVETREGAA